MDDKKKESKDLTGSEMLDALASCAYGADEFPSKAEAREILNEEKIDTSDMHEWLTGKVQGIKARQKLLSAKDQRLRALELLGNCRQKVAVQGSSLKEHILEKLQILSSSNPAAAQVYCRKFEETPEADLPDLEAELMALEEMGDEFEER